MKLSIRQLNIFPKLLFTFLLAILPMYIVSLYMNESGKNSVHEEISKSMKSRVHYYVSTFNLEMSKLINFKQEYIFDDDVQNLSVLASTMSDFDQRSAMLRIQKQMVNIKNSSTFVNDVIVNVPLIQKKISTTRISSDMGEEEAAVLQRASTQSSPFIAWNNLFLLGETYPSSNNVKRKPILEIEVKLDVDQIKHSLLETTQMNSGGTMILDREHKWSISSDEQNPILSQLKLLFSDLRIKGQETGQTTIQILGEDYLTTYEYSSMLDTMFVIYVPEKQILGSLNKYRIGFYVLSVLSLMTVVLFSYWIFGNIHRPLYRLVRAFRRVEASDLTINLSYEYQDEFGYLYKQFNEMVSKLNVLIHEVYEQQIRSQQSELKQLQAQIDPHFLYNSFYYLYRMAEMHEIENVIKFSHYLGDFLHFITRSGSEEVTLEREYKHAIAYIEIQAMRFSNRITATYEELPEACKSLIVPRLIIQPIIENAFHHGLEDKMEDGRIIVKIFYDDLTVRILVEDNGESLSDEQLENLQQILRTTEKTKETTGIINVHRRLKLKYGEQAGLSVERGSLGGLKVCLQIPYAKGVVSCSDF